MKKTFAAALVSFALLLAPSAGFSAQEDGESHQLRPNVNSSDAAGHTPLHRAALRGDAAAVEALLATGADPNALNQYGATPLHYGVGSERIVATLLAHGANPNIASQAGNTPLCSAVAQMNSFAVVQRLLAAGAELNVQRVEIAERNSTLLADAVGGGDRRTIALLLDPKNKIDPKQLGTGLIAAAQVGDLETARVLIERGVDINFLTGTTGSPLNTALRSGRNDVAKLLIERGADLKVKSNRGYGTSAIVFSAYTDACDPAMTKLLLDRGVDIDTANDIGDTALSYALKQGPDTELVRFLVDRGAKPPPAPANLKTIPQRAVPTDEAGRAALVRFSAQRAIDLLQRSSRGFLESGFVRNQAKCISCHQQALPAVAYGLARERGLRVDDHEIGRQLSAKFTQRSEQVGKALELIAPTGGPVLSLGYDADELNALNVAPNDVTDAMSHYLLGVQRTDGSWLSPLRRVPMGDDFVVATAWGIRALQLYPPAERKNEAAAAVLRAREWLGKQQPPTLNERVFQLLGLAWANESKARLQPFAETLAKEQRPDGGWSQLPGIASDAWATGSALHALYKAGMPTSHAVYRRGTDFLLRTQFDDGSWWVKTRSWPFQPHFDTGFPHGRDQWISAAGTAWATMAILLTLEPTVDPARLPKAEELIASFRKSSSEKTPGAAARPVTNPSSGTARIDFVRDIQPIFERSCVGCHGGEKPKSGFALISREALLRGGQSGEPAIVLGHAQESQLVRYVSDAVEDLEMPPLGRREKYPALAAEEIARLRTWIDAGAPWPTTKTANVNSP